MSWRIFVAFLLSSATTFGQVEKPDLNLENFVEEIISQNGEEEDIDDLIENLIQILTQPLSLNKCTPEDLKSILILSPHQIESFFEYKRINGDLTNIYELQAIPNFDLETIYKLLPFVTINPLEQSKNKSLIDKMRSEKDAYFILRQSRTLESRKGFSKPDTLQNGNLTSRYQGDPNHIFGRFRVNRVKDYSIGLTFEKDAGEQFIWDPSSNRRGFDFLSYHLTLYQRKRWKTLTFGDFRAQFGQGLVFGGGFGLGKGAETITTIRRSSTGLSPYTSAIESGFFRGVGGTYQLKNLEFTLFISFAPRDGNIEQEVIAENEVKSILRSMPTSGFHRTPTEISYKHSSQEQNVGFNAQYKTTKLMVGYSGLATKFEYPFVRRSSVHNSFEFTGQENQVHGAYFSYLISNIYAFGEYAVSSSGGKGSVLGFMGSLDKKFDFAFLSRKFEKNFHSFYGSAFGESSRPINESGLYLGLNYKFNPKLNLSFYYDVFEFPWLRFRSYKPSNGEEWMGRITYKPKRNLKMFAQFREERKWRNLPASQSTFYYMGDEGIKRNYLFHLEGLLIKPWSFRTRVQGSSFDFAQGKTFGFAMSQDIHADFNRWRFSTRLALFDTDDFDNRQFFFERNVLWAFSMPSLSGQGMRYYFLTQYKMNKRLTLWMRWARTSYTDKETISSGLQEIRDHKQTDVVFQLRYQMNR
jgi:hypothetical protein